MLRTDALALLLLQRLHALGPCSEKEAIDVLDDRAPGRGREVIRWAGQRGMVRVVAGVDGKPMVEAAGAPLSRAS